MRLRLSIFIIAAIAGVLLVLPKLSVAAPPCLDYNTDFNGSDCPGTQLCVGTPLQCVSFALDLTNPTSTATTTSVNIETSGYLDPTYQTWGCVGRNVTCQTPTARPTFWTDLGTRNVPFVATMSGLRPGRTFTETYYGTYSTATDTQTQTFTTWPAYTTPATVSNISENGATVTWDTVFSGTSDLYYGALPPSWKTEQAVGSDAVTAVAAASTGKAWAGTYNGALYRRSAGAWSLTTTIPTHFRSLDAYNDQTVWAAGDGAIYRTTDGGSSWLPISPSGPIPAVLDVTAATNTTAWAVGQNETILFYDGSSWVSKYSSGGSNDFWTVFTLDNKDVFVAGKAGALIKSNDAGATWSAPITLPGAGATDIVDDVYSLDGITLWASGTNGRLWRSSNSGATWSSVPSGTTDEIVSIGQPSPSSLLLFTKTSLGTSANAQTASPTISYSVVTGATLINDGTMVNGAEYIAVTDDVITSYSMYNSLPGYLAGTGATAHAVDLTGALVDNKTYYFAAITNGSGVGWGTFGTFRTLTRDNIAPTIAITDPASSPQYTNVSPYTVRGTANDNLNLKLITLTSNGTPQSVTSNPALPGQTSVTWSSAVALQNGTNALSATATDNSNNNSSPASGTLIYDTQGPTVTIANPVGSSTVNTSTITANGTAIDNSVTGDQVSLMEYSLNGAPRQAFTITPGGTVNWTASIPNLNLGSNTLIVFARDRAGNEGSKTVTFTYSEPTFVLTVAPSSQTKNAGDTVTYTVTLVSANGFSGNVALTITGTPGGSTATFSPNPVPLAANGTATSTLTIVTNGTTTGTFTMNVTGTGNGKSDTATATLILNPAPDFTLSAIPVQQNIIGGNSTSYQIHASANSTFSGNVVFTLTGQPAGVGGGFAPSTVALAANGNQVSTLNITTQASSPAGSHTLTVTGTSGSLVRTVTIILNISAPPDIVITLQPASQTVTGGGNTSYNGTVKAVNGFADQVTLTAAISPAEPNTTLSLNPSQFVPTAAGTPFIMNVTTTSAAAPGTYTITVTATSTPTPPATAIVKSTTVTLIINLDTTPPVISNIVATPNWNSVRITWQTDELANSEVDIFTDAARTTVVGIVTDATYCLSGCHDISYTPLNPSTTYYFTVTSTDQSPNANKATRTLADDGITPLQFTTLAEPDTVPPTVVVNNPGAGVTDVVGTVNIDGTAADDKNVSQVHVVITPQAGGTAVFNQSIGCTGTSCSWSTTWSTMGPPILVGTYDITVTAIDKAGNVSTPVVRTVNVVNDNTYPQITGPNAQVDPMPGVTNCGGGQCYQAVITWTTTKPATTEIEYCAGLTCTYGPRRAGDDADPTAPQALYTSHQITLLRLDANQIYHYKITSCNISGLCSS